jgi:uncharacterized protein (TIGR02246 family)
MSVAQDNTAIKNLALAYAQAVDRRDTVLLLSLFSDEAEIVMPGSCLKGKAELAGIATMLEQMFESTQHKVFNHRAEINGDTATAETYGTASHLRLLENGKREVEDWAVRYQDKLVKHNGEWLFSRRELVIDWVEVRPAMAFGEQFK